MRLCSCDPDVHHPSFALYDGGLKGYLQVKGKTVEEWIPHVQKLVESWSPELLVIENQYLPMSDPGKNGTRRTLSTHEMAHRFRSLATLVAARGMIQGVFSLYGIPFKIIEPFT